MMASDGGLRRPASLATLASARGAAAVALALVFCCPAARAADAPRTAAGGERESTCALDLGEPNGVAKVIDGQTIRLTDGREIRLIGALAPHAFDAGVAEPDWPAEGEARAALGALVAGHSVQLAAVGRRSDRYGHQLAQVFLDRDGRRVWVQAAMIEAGHARAYGLPGSFDCLPELIAHETVARSRGAGLWRNPAYAVRRAEAARELLRLRNTYQVVEGTVSEVGNVRGHVYLNFGDNWRDDFTAGIATARQDRGWLDEMRAMTGRRLRVRGWIERRNGPYIAVSDRAQIEVLDVPPGSAENATAPEATEQPAEQPAQPEAGD